MDKSFSKANAKVLLIGILLPISFLLIAFSTIAQQSDFHRKCALLFENTFADNEPGGSILVMKGDEIKFLGNYGVADISTNEKISEHTIFNTGSISKTFVANGILILQEAGKLSVTDQLDKFFKDFDDPEISKKVHIEHLLSHTSGLPDIRNVSNNQEFFLTAKDEENWASIKKTNSFDFLPGERFQYSNPAYNGLALIIEQVSGDKWQEFITERIFIPSGMINSKITDGEFPNEGVAHAYVSSGEKYIENDYGEVPTFAAAGNGGIWSSVIELAKYENAIRSNTFLSQQSIDISRKPFQPANWKGQGPAYIGHSWFLGEQQLIGTNKLGVEIVSHTGSQGGFRAFFISIPSKDIVYIALFNRPVSEMRAFMAKGLELIKEANWFE